MKIKLETAGAKSMRYLCKKISKTITKFCIPSGLMNLIFEMFSRAGDHAF